MNDIHFIIADNDADEAYFKNTSYSFTKFPVAKLRRYFSWENLRDGFRFIANLMRAWWWIRKNKPEKIFSKGGFVSLPFGIVAKIFNIPFYLHETDSVMGLSNSILSRFATKIFTGFPSNTPSHVFVGNPVRKAFFKPYSSTNAVPPKVLVFGGSQGAKALNDWTRSFFGKRSDLAQVLLLAGRGKTEQHSFPNIHEVEFLHEDFIDAVRDADVVIARAGGSISELAAAKKCVVLVPLPSAANDHQRKNAASIAQKNAGKVIEEADLYAPQTEDLICELLRNADLRETLANNLSALAKKDTVEKIGDVMG